MKTAYGIRTKDILEFDKFILHKNAGLCIYEKERDMEEVKVLFTYLLETGS